MSVVNTTSKLPHRPPTAQSPINAITSLSRSHSRTRRRLIDRTPRPVGHSLPGAATDAASKRKLVTAETDSSDETRRGRSITRDLSSEELGAVIASNANSDEKWRRRRRRSESPSRGSQLSDERDRQSTSIRKKKRRRTTKVSIDDLKHLVGECEYREGKGKGANRERERSRSRLRARYRRMSDKASAEIQKGRFSDSRAARNDEVGRSDNDNPIRGSDSDQDAQGALSKGKEDGIHQKVFLGWGNAEREEWGVGMRNREEVAGRKAEGRRWLRGKRN